MDGREYDRRIVSAIRRSGELLAAVGLAGPALISLLIDGGEDLRLLVEGMAGSPLGLPSTVFNTLRIEDPRAPLPEEMRPLLDDVWQACGWEDGTPSIDEYGWVNDTFGQDGVDDGTFG